MSDSEVASDAAAGDPGSAGSAGTGGDGAMPPDAASAGSGGAPAAGSGGRQSAAGSGGSPSPACPNRDLPLGDSTRTLLHDGVAREYVVHVPPRYDGETYVPLVVDIHGFTLSASHQQSMSGWREKSDAEGFLVVYPIGLDASWNGGSVCCGPSQADAVDDEGFVRALVTQLERDACIDPTRVYATGLSNGGALSYVLACNSADVFAAVAPVSIGNGAIPCSPSRPLSVVMFRGTADDLVPYEGDATYPSAIVDLNQWKLLNSCTRAAEKVHGVCDRYTGCAGGVEVTLCTIPNGRHILYADAASAGAAVAEVGWEVFARHALP